MSSGEPRSFTRGAARSRVPDVDMLRKAASLGKAA